MALCKTIEKNIDTDQIRTEASALAANLAGQAERAAEWVGPRVTKAAGGVARAAKEAQERLEPAYEEARTRVVEDGTGVVEVCIHAQVFLFEQGAYARHTRAVGWVDGRDHSSSYAWGSRGFPCSSSVIKARICGRAALCSV